MSFAPNPPEIPQTLHFTSICQDKKLNAHTHTNITNQHHVMRCSSSHFPPRPSRSSQSVLHLRAVILANLSYFEFRSLSEFLKHLEFKQPLYTQQNVERNHIGVYPDHMDDQKGAFDCLLSDSPCQYFSWLIGKWREFRPSSSWVFGSWEVVNSGTGGGTENGDARPL